MDMRNILASVAKLAQMDPQDAAVDATIQELTEEISQLKDAAKETESDRVESVMQDDMDLLQEQIKVLHSAAVTPARNFARIQSICAGLHRAAAIAARPQYAELRPRLTDLTLKVAGIFAEIDTTKDLDKPLEQIEKAVHSMYGAQDKNSTFYLERRNKGHLGEK